MTPADLQAFVRRAAKRYPVSHELECMFWGPPMHFPDQRAHWHGWLGMHRERGTPTAARVYNQLASPPMLLWLAEAAGIPGDKVRKAGMDGQREKRRHRQCKVIRSHIPWPSIWKLISNG